MDNKLGVPKTSTMASETTIAGTPNIVDKEAQDPLKDGSLSDHHDSHAHPLAQLSSARKHFLLLIFAISTFVDVCNVSGVAIAVAQIGMDIGLGISQLVWLLFAGRLSDLFPASVIFEVGFAALGVFSLAVSFVTSSKYGFLILRGLGGAAGALTIPSAYHLLVHMFPNPQEQQAKLALLGLAGAAGNVLGLVLAGLAMLKGYSVFFQLMAGICLAFSALTVWLLPYTGSSYSTSGDKTPRWKRMDIIGVLLMMGTLICFILSLTQGPIDGWSSASFIAPFVLSWFLGVGFFVWEAWIPARSAVLPSSIWKITNIIIASLVTLFPFAFWATSQIQYATFWQEVLHWSPIHVAAAMLPQGIIALILGGVTQAVPGIITKPKITIPVGAVLIIVSEILMVYSDGGRGMKYWSFVFPAFLLGSSGAIISYFASAVNLISYCPPEMAGVAGAWTQVLAQIGGAICLAVQAGLQTNNLADWKQSSGRAFWFLVAWVAVLAITYVVFHREPGTPEEEHELARKRIKDAGIDEGV